MRHSINIYTVLLFIAATWMATPAHAQVSRYLRRGNESFKASEFKDAEHDYNEALKREPDSYDANFNMGDALYKQKRFKEAAAFFQRAATLSHNSSQWHQSNYNLGNSCLKQDDIEQSITAYKNALKADPGDIYAKYNLSYALEKRRRKQNETAGMMPKPKPEKQDDNKGKDNQPGQKPEGKDQPFTNKTGKEKEGITDKEADQILNALKNDEQKIRARMYDRNSRRERSRTDKPW